jgi:hypothetical protein
VLLKANAFEVITAADGMICTGLRVASFDGKPGQVDAPVVVLRGGGIENARLLLLSRSHKKTASGTIKISWDGFCRIIRRRTKAKNCEFLSYKYAGFSCALRNALPGRFSIFPQVLP